MFTKLLTTLRILRRDEKGATAIEYGLIAALISLALIAGANVAGPQLKTLFTKVGTDLTTASSAN